VGGTPGAERRLNISRLIASGMYDPEAPTAADRLELLEHLISAGFSYERLQEVYEQRGAAGLLEDLLGTSALAGDLVDSFVSRERLSTEQVAEQLGTDIALVRRARAALGMPTTDDTEEAIPATFVDDMAAVLFGIAMFGEAPTMGLLRVVGASASRIAEATQSMMFGDLASDLLAQPGGELALLKANQAATAALPVIPAAFANAFYEHMNTVNRRMRGDVRNQIAMDTFEAAVAFVDLVSSTPWAARVDHREHGAALNAFESTAWDLAVHAGCRVVKAIGDEVMIAGPDVGDVVSVAVRLCAAAAGDDRLPPARGGVAVGPVTTRDGDYFGPTVNLAARCRSRYRKRCSNGLTHTILSSRRSATTTCEASRRRRRSTRSAWARSSQRPTAPVRSSRAWLLPCFPPWVR
jgi:class 3 adenylate cyclase